MSNKERSVNIKDCAIRWLIKAESIKTHGAHNFKMTNLSVQNRCSKIPPWTSAVKSRVRISRVVRLSWSARLLMQAPASKMQANSSSSAVVPNIFSLAYPLAAYFHKLYLSSKFFLIHQLMHNWIVLKIILKFTLKLTLKQLQHVSV
jgi:hypothetical protein